MGANDCPDSPTDLSLWPCMRTRRQFGLRRLCAPGPDASVLRSLFEAAAQAPDHGTLVPWRFVLVPLDKRPLLGQAFAEALVQRDPGADETARSAAYDKAFHAPCLVAAILVDDRTSKAIPVEEKLVSLGCAIQNMLLGATAAGFQSGLASGVAMDAPPLRRLLGLAAHERAICFIGIGSTADSAAAIKPPRERPAPERFVSSL